MVQETSKSFCSVNNAMIVSNAKSLVSTSTRQKQDRDLERSDSFNILLVVQERGNIIDCAEYEARVSNYWSTQCDDAGGVGRDMGSRSAASSQSLAQPGAYTEAPGTTTDRVDNLNLSLVGRGPGIVLDPTPSSGNSVTAQEGSSASTTMRRPARALTENNNNNNGNPSNNGRLLEAVRIESDQFRLRSMMEAQPIDQENLDQRALDEAKYERWKWFGCGIVVLALVVIAMSLAIGLASQEETTIVLVNYDTQSPTTSPTRLPPPMENLELLYSELPPKTKDSLYRKESPQYHAWEWLLHHPNITTYPEWRKKQIFAMATFFYSFEGPNWPQATPNRDRWMDATVSECSWVLSQAETAYFAHESAAILEYSHPYDHQDYQPCNEDGELQTLMVHHLYLPAHLKPSIPPEMELLTSLRIVGVILSQINAKLSDLLVPEFVRLPKLSLLNFHSSGVSGTIPKDISLMTGLRDLVIGANKLTGSIPVEISKLTSLESFFPFTLPGLTGTLPSELGLMTRLKQLEFGGCSLMGSIPSQVGLLTQSRVISLWKNSLTGGVPSELGLLTNMAILNLDHNHLNGRVPSEMGLMTGIRRLLLNNNAFNGSIPSEIGAMTDVDTLFLGNDMNDEGSYNHFSGDLPKEFWGLSHLEWLFLSNLPNLHGSIPTDIATHNMTLLRLEGTPHLRGTVPEQLCALQERTAAKFLQGPTLGFDCSDMLCGCNCECAGSNANDTNKP